MAAPHYDLIVIGEGVAGLTAARDASRAGMKTATIEASLFGGLITNINTLDPAPVIDGSEPSAMGADVAAALFEACIEAGAEHIDDRVVALRRGATGLSLQTEQTEYSAAQVIIASGAHIRPLGVPGEAEFTGRGVSQCADCDGPLYHGKEVVVVGGGDSALQEALALAEHCSRVHLVHRRDQFRGRDDLVARIRASSKVRIHWNAEVDAIEGNAAVEGVRLRQAGATTHLPCAGVFAYIGLIPNTAFLPAEVILDASSRVRTNALLLSSMPGVYAAGAVRAGCGGTAQDAIRDGCEAARNVAARRA
ncbi:MAG: NAD(P)/FAD-dependent oxidoreductase [Burkholderiales bacterium]